mmetsp:Transcript_25857/g.64598  ORF Transcript_25857/g.64598 Transcript_25857/m.64598 type:complete len:106 (-) Transcript_25857:3354-3671(-)
MRTGDGEGRARSLCILGHARRGDEATRMLGAASFPGSMAPSKAAFPGSMAPSQAASFSMNPAWRASSRMPMCAGVAVGKVIPPSYPSLRVITVNDEDSPPQRNSA